jgi:hypothetical protein
MYVFIASYNIPMTMNVIISCMSSMFPSISVKCQSLMFRNFHELISQF